MDGRRIDAAARQLASGLSRRRVLGILARGVASGAVILFTGARAGAQPGCRREGHPCEGNQTCCAGLTCAESQPGSARRCTADATAECTGDCPATAPAVVVVDVDIDIEADCAYSGEMRRTTCTFIAAAGAGTVGSITVPESILCAEVVGGDFEEVDLGANVRPKGKTKGFKSKQTADGTVIVTLELAGDVSIAATATYWCETDRVALIPVTGPGLSCEATVTPPNNDISDSTGAIVVQAYACDVAADSADVAWFEACAAPTAAATFRLSRAEGGSVVEVGSQATDEEGICRFGQLAPGTYRLKQTDGVWCHAESDRVDERGDVVVEAGARATVWIFHCEAVK